MLIEPNETRTRLTRLVYAQPGEHCPLGRLEEAFHKICAVEDLERKVMLAVKDNTLKSLTLMDQVDEALEHKILSKAEAKQLQEAELARQDVIKVDDFADEELRRTSKEKRTVISHPKQDQAL